MQTVIRSKVISDKYIDKFERKMDTFLRDKESYSVQFKPIGNFMIALVMYPVQIEGPHQSKGAPTGVEGESYSLDSGDPNTMFTD